MDRKKQTNNHCPNCGAPVSTEVCPYCSAVTGINTWQADMEYPVIECKEANIGFWTVYFPMIFAVGFGFFGFIFPIIFFLIDTSLGLFSLLFNGIFAIVAVVAFIIGIRPILRNSKIKKYGKEIEGTIYGYIDDKIIINNVPAQIAKILVKTNDGPKFILYQLGDIHQLYKINSKIKLKVYKDYFLIINNNDIYFN